MSATHQRPDPSGPLDERIRAALDQEEYRLLRAIAERGGPDLARCTEEEDIGEIASSSQHPADVASETYEREVDFGLVEDFRWRIDEVTEAKRRLANGRYGRCERCDQLVDADRLTALPATRWCRDCAAQVERDAEWLRLLDGGRGGVLQTSEFLADDDESEPSDPDTGPEEAAVTVR